MILPTLIGLGFLLGIRHALDADHVIAVSNILTRERSVGRAMSVGLLWGTGHTLTIVVIGGAIILLQATVSPRAELLLELPVAAMLIFLGLRTLHSSFPRAAIEQHHDHLHDDLQRHGMQQAPLAAVDRWFGSLTRASRPVIIGVVHGLAGSAAIALLILPIIDSRWGAILYLTLFGAGTIVGMIVVTAALAIPLSAGGSRWASWRSATTALVGAISIGFGLFLGGEIYTALSHLN
jgi:high-affinity nickel permease